jgi:hypothetical protein
LKWSSIDQENIPPRSNPIIKPPKAYRVPTMSGKVKWIDEALEEVMDAIESGNTTLRKASRF